MQMFRIALAHIRYPATPEDSVSLAEQAVTQASMAGASLVCLPECFVGIARHVEPQNLAPVMADHKEAVQDAKSERWYREEVHGCNSLAMVAQKRQPTLAHIWTLRRPSKPSRYRGFRYVEAQL